MQRCTFGLLALLSALVTSHALAEPDQAKPATNAVCDRESTAIGRSACRLAESIAGQADSALVVATGALGDERVALPATVSERLAQLVAAKLGPASRFSKEPLTLAQAQSMTSSARGLIYLTVSLYRDRLDVSADVFVGSGRFWQRLKNPGLKLKAHTFATTALDPELRALFPAIPLVVSRVDKAQTAEHDILALACGDLRGDGSSEIATVGRRRVQVGRLEHGRFAARASLNWADNSAIAGSPLREPIAVSTVPEPGRLRVGLSDRADGLELSGALRVEQRWHALMPWPGAGCTRRAGIGYEGKARACPGSAPTPEVDFGTPVDAFDSRALTDQSGQLHIVRVARPLGADFARALDSLHPEVVVPDVGAQLAVGDLDEDGLPEIVTSSPTLDRRADQLLVRTLTTNGQLRERLRLPVPSGIDALAICPGDGRAMAPLALATGDGIWLIR
ncbi:MAG TPA: hypothetical protein VFK05_05110 [Polyangiaceae bacterium]|nr:hypothetical protein [Polyangiaceae bacterium]